MFKAQCPWCGHWIQTFYERNLPILEADHRQNCKQAKRADTRPLTALDEKFLKELLVAW